MHVGILGINHKLAPLSLRDELARVCARRFGPGQSLHPNHSFVLLSTCNRTEIYFCAPDLTQAHHYILKILKQELFVPFEQKLYTFFGQDCFSHLVRVTSGLDSALIGETEIQGQVKLAYAQAMHHHKLQAPLHTLFQKGLKVSKKIRTQLLQKKAIPSIEHALLHATHQHLDHPQQLPTLLIGASKTNLKIFKFLKSRRFESLTLANRTIEKGQAVANRHGMSFVPLDRVRWTDYPLILVATHSPTPLIRSGHPHQNHLIFDLSVPRNVDPHLGKQPHIDLINIDQLHAKIIQSQRHLEQTVRHAEQLIHETFHAQNRPHRLEDIQVNA